jgi:periplasmic divalent cation tolerance protein
MTRESPYRFIYVTTGNRSEALKIGRFLVQQRLVACANVLSGMTAVYWWEGKVEEGDEAILIAKTTADRVEQVMVAVKEQHSYDCPCVIALPIMAGLPDYLGWVHDETHPR